MNIEGLGAKLIDQWVDQGLVSTPADLYELTTEQLLTVERMGEQSARKLTVALERSKATLPRFLYALGVPEVGEAIAATLASDLGSLGELQSADKPRLEQVKDFGPIVASNVHAPFQEEHNRSLTKRLRSTGSHWPDPARSRRDSTLSGKTSVITGTLSTLSRSQAKERPIALGASVAESVSKKTDYVIVGSDAGSKAKRADELGIRTLAEPDLLSLLQAETND
jgi:DNA ligase (NAD+)